MAAESNIGISTPEMIKAAVDGADLNALRVALYQATGDLRLAHLRIERKPVRNGAAFIEVIADADVPILKDLATQFLLNRESWVPPAQPPGRPELRLLMEMLTGKPLTDDEFAMGLEELAFDEFPRQANWSAGRPNVTGFNVLVIGAGISGIAVAVQLQRLGIPYTVVEREDGIGGVWLRNQYLDARVDSPCVGYQYKFVKDYRWSEMYPARAEVVTYLEMVAERYQVTPNIRFGHEVKDARWDEATNTWEVRLADHNGDESALIANVLVTACGLFNLPKLPNAPGLEVFRGLVAHPTEWRQDLDLAGKRVAVIGNGSTGVQLMPRVAEVAGTLAVYQRTPSWIAPVEGYKQCLPAAANWLLDNMPFYWNWQIYSSFVGDSRLFLDAQRYDPEWQSRGGLISETNDSLRAWLTSYIAEKVAGRPELLPRLIPGYAPLGRRLVVDNGYYDALLRQNVELVTDEIVGFTPDGITTGDGVERKFDAIIAATGYKVMEYLWPAQYTGRDGQTLSAAWEAEGPRAYLGLTVPGFPNLFILYGPNGQARAGNFHSWAEIWARYVLQAIIQLVESGNHSIEVRADVCHSYNRELDDAMASIIWSTEAANGYYAVQKGRGAVSMPWEHYEYHRMIRDLNTDDFIIK